MAKQKKRCILCGKPIEGEGFRISRGEVEQDGGWCEAELFGLLHPGCFTTAVDSPELVLTELRRVHESGTEAAAHGT